MPDDDDLADDSADGKVHAHRFAKVVAQKNELKAKLAEYERDVPALREAATKAGTLEGELAKERAARAADAEAWGTERAFMDNGIVDPEDRELVLHHFGKLDSKDRPKPADWIAGLKADPTKAPKHLRGMFAPAEVPEPPDKGGKAPPKIKRSADPNSGGSANDAPADATAIRAARENAQKTGVWDDYFKLTGRTPPPKR